jgi:GNAT superfamily N-acetyltransferase
VTIIRRARADEASVVAGLWTEAAAWLASRGIDQWQYEPHHDRIAASVAAGECWLAEWDGWVVGTITVDGRADPEFWTAADHPDAALYAHRMVVARAAAGTGLGARLLDHAGRLAAEAGKRWLRLDAWRDNPGLADYYRSQGFTEVRTVVLAHRRSGVLFQREAG